MTLAVKENEPLYPAAIGVLSSQTQMSEPRFVPYSIKEFPLTHSWCIIPRIAVLCDSFDRYLGCSAAALANESSQTKISQFLRRFLDFVTLQNESNFRKLKTINLNKTGETK
jgi:hypothetical protein